MKPETPIPQLHADFHRMHDLVHSIGDADPSSTVLRQFADDLDLTGVDRLRLTMTYVAVQHLGTAITAFTGTKSYREMIEALRSHHGKIATGNERRAHQIPSALARHLMHLDQLENTWDGLDSYLYAKVEEPATPTGMIARVGNWRTVYSKVEKIFGNGPWAADRTCRLLIDLHGWPLAPPDWNNRDVPAQRRALTELYPHVKPSPDPAVIVQFNQVATILQADLQREGLPSAMHQVAASLQLFDRMLRGRYYPGLGLDQQYQEICQAVPVGYPTGSMPTLGMPHIAALFEARRLSFPDAYLCELNNTIGVPDLQRARIYNLTGKIASR